MSHQYELHETANYSGADNPCIYTREFDLEFKCFFDLIYYPFDTQTCKIELKAGNKIRNFITLMPETFNFVGKEILSTFIITDCWMEFDSSSSDVDIRVKIVLKRRLAQHMLGIFLPSLCIIIIAQVSSRIQLSCDLDKYLLSGNPVLQARAFQDCHPGLHHRHAGHVHSQQLYCCKSPAILGHQVH